MSLSTRIVVRLAITTVVATIVAYGWLYLKQSHVKDYLRERVLVRQAQEISNFISINDNGSIDLNLPPNLSEAYNNPGSSYRYAIRDESGRIVATSGRRVGPLPQLIHSERRSYEYRDEITGTRMVGAIFKSAIDQRPFITQVEQTVPMLQSLNAAVFNEFISDGGWLGIPFLCALLGVSAFTVKRSLAPLDKLSTTATEINPGNSTLRLPHDGIPREIPPLVESINGALDRLDDALRRQREFGANAAHQLRTPLAVLSANIDLMGDKDAAAKLRYDVDLMTRIVGQLLLVARLETLNNRLDEPVDLTSSAREVAANLGPIAVASHKSLEVEAPDNPILVRGGGVVITAAIRNLIENALSHSPRGGTVRIRVTTMPSLEVNDSGPGVPPELREKVFDRFWRGDNSKEGGAGLGLAIVRRIMHALSGTVSVSIAPEGGAQFTLNFPLFVSGSEAAHA